MSLNVVKMFARATFASRTRRQTPTHLATTTLQSSSSSGNRFNLVTLRACLRTLCLVKLDLDACLRKSRCLPFPRQHGRLGIVLRRELPPDVQRMAFYDFVSKIGTQPIATDNDRYQALVSKSPTRLFAGNSADELGAWASRLPGSGLLERTFGTFLINRRLSLRWPKGARQACERTRR
jgi:hypothetical protein